MKVKNFSAFRRVWSHFGCLRWPPSEMAPTPSEICLGVIGMSTVDENFRLTAVTRSIALFHLMMVAFRFRSTRR